jgi:hypothetical protein
MSDFLERVARRALQPCELVPRTPSRFESRRVDSARIDEAEDWLVASRPQSDFPRQATQAALPADEDRPPITAKITETLERTAPADISDSRHDAAAPRQSVPAMRIESVASLDQPRPTPSEPGVAVAAVTRSPSDLQILPGETDSEAEDRVVQEGPTESLQIDHLLRLEPSVELAPVKLGGASDSPRRRDSPPRNAIESHQAALERDGAMPLQVEINIDRIEVRAQVPAPAIAPAALPSHAQRLPPMSLDEHLRRRRGEPR